MFYDFTEKKLLDLQLEKEENSVSLQLDADEADSNGTILVKNIVILIYELNAFSH